MVDEWYCEINGRMIGPLSSQQLKAMAASGHLLPTDAVRRRDEIDWVEADQVVGLFESPSPPRVIEPPKGVPPALPAQDSPEATPILQYSEAPPYMPSAKAPTPAQAGTALGPFDTPFLLNRSRFSPLRARSRHRRQQQMLITGVTAFVAVGVVIVYVILTAGGFDTSKGELKEAAQKPADQSITTPEKREPPRPAPVATPKEPKAVAAKPSVNEKQAVVLANVATAKQASEKPAEKPAEKEEPEVPDNEDESQWIDASTMSPAVFDKIQVDVLSAAWEGGEAETPESSRLAIAIRVRNMGVAFPVNFGGWSPEAAQHGVTLIDNRRKTVKPKAADAANTVENMLPIKINPGKSARDVLLFDPPSPKVKYLRLQLSAEAFGKEGTARFKIPASMIEGTPPKPPKPPAPKPVEKPKPPLGRDRSSNPKDDFGIDPNASPPQ
jgi:hypothetical protein